MDKHPTKISSVDLRLRDIPDDNAPIDALNAFALTFDGYAYRDASECDDSSKECSSCSLDSLRWCLFIQARRQHFIARLVPVNESSEQALKRQIEFAAEEADLLRNWRHLVHKIRDCVAGRLD